jgi:acyl dehydratase
MSEILNIRPLSLTTTPEIILVHGRLVKDFNPLHFDSDFAAATVFGAPIIHGSLMLSLLTEAIERSAADLIRNARFDLRFIAPAFVGQTLTAGGQAVEGKQNAYDVWVMREYDVQVVSGTLTIGENQEGSR